MMGSMTTERMSIGSGDPAILPIATTPPGKGVHVEGSSTPTRRPGYDLRSTASGAAIELDNIILGRGTKTSALDQLVRVLESGIPAAEQRAEPMAMITPTVVVMDRVVRKVRPGAILDEVINEYDRFVNELKQVTSCTYPVERSDEELEILRRLRTTCLALSRFASSLRRPPSVPSRNPRRS